jgi:acetylglutamate kinase
LPKFYLAAMTEEELLYQPLQAGYKKEQLYVIKTGGNVIDDQTSLHSFLTDFSSIRGRKILVHGGGKIATAIGEKLGIESNYIDGRRITDDVAIDLVTMVYAGLLNKKIVATLQSLHCNAIGLTGADGNLLPARKRPVKTIDYGWVGDLNAAEVDPVLWKLFIDNGLVPVVASLTHDRHGHILNTNADTIAAVLSAALSTSYHVTLVYCFEKNGVLQDVNNEQSFLPRLNAKAYADLVKDKKLFAGILPKIDNAFDAINNGVEEVVIGNSNSLLQMIKGETGTRILV